MRRMDRSSTHVFSIIVNRFVTLVILSYQTMYIFLCIGCTGWFCEKELKGILGILEEMVQMVDAAFAKCWREVGFKNPTGLF